MLTSSLAIAWGRNMLIYIRALKSLREINKLLLEDGWHMEDLGSGTFTARHTRVVDEAAALQRLLHLGLLTSSRLRICYNHHHTSRRLSVHKSHTHSPRFLHAATVSATY
jgi:hypothetical protein